LEIASQGGFERELNREFLFGFENSERRPPAHGKTEFVEACENGRSTIRKKSEAPHAKPAHGAPGVPLCSNGDAVLLE
jgi:hypothetical protein